MRAIRSLSTCLERHLPEKDWVARGNFKNGMGKKLGDSNAIFETSRRSWEVAASPLGCLVGRPERGGEAP